ncbi:Spore germination protein B3 [bioreactor metagenome]|uniref:Spore germination protein B3 n=1 Tax=bioreactor metagenome TaxID=1076179 RepID=A0A644WYB5_9ZZZZ
MKKRIALFGVLTFILAFLPGCQDYKEVEHVSIVVGCALDKSSEDKTYHLAVEVLKPSGEKNSDTKSIILEAEGDTIFEAVKNLNEITRKEPYWSNCQIVVISEELAKEGILPLIDFFIRGPETRPTIYALISQEKTAREILMQKNEISSVVSFGLRSMVEANYDVLSTTNDLNLLKTANILYGDGGTALTLPAVRNSSNNGSLTSEINGVAVFAKDKMIGYLDPEDTKYFLFAADKVQGGSLSGFIAPGIHGMIGGRLYENSTEIKPVYENGKLTVSIETETKVSIIEQGIGFSTEESVISSSEKYWKQSLEKNIDRVIKLVQVKFGQDIFGFGDVISKKNPKAWEELEPEWSSVFKNLKTEVTSDIIVLDSGLIGNK